MRAPRRAVQRVDVPRRAQLCMWRRELWQRPAGQGWVREVEEVRLPSESSRAVEEGVRVAPDAVTETGSWPTTARSITSGRAPVRTRLPACGRSIVPRQLLRDLPPAGSEPLAERRVVEQTPHGARDGSSPVRDDDAPRSPRCSATPQRSVTTDRSPGSSRLGRHHPEALVPRRQDEDVSLAVEVERATDRDEAMDVNAPGGSGLVAAARAVERAVAVVRPDDREVGAGQRAALPPGGGRGPSLKLTRPTFNTSGTSSIPSSRTEAPIAISPGGKAVRPHHDPDCDAAATSSARSSSETATTPPLRARPLDRRVEQTLEQDCGTR